MDKTLRTYRVAVGCYSNTYPDKMMVSDTIVQATSILDAFNVAFPGAHGSRRGDDYLVYMWRRGSLREHMMLAHIECISDISGMNSNNIEGYATCDEFIEAENWYEVDLENPSDIDWILSVVSEPKKRGKRRVWER